MSLKDEIVLAVQQEIQNDPMGRGYTGKSDAEIVDLLNDSYFVTSTTQTEVPSRMNQILLGIADSPNVITLDDFQFVKGN